MNDASIKVETVAETKHLRLVQKGRWSFVQRTKGCGVVCVVARTDEGKVLLVEQYRAPVDRDVIELPAGLVGDDEAAGEETLAEGARRELLEETGYLAGKMTKLFAGASSAGLTDETVTFFLAEDLQKQDDGGGVGHERITVHEIPLAEIDAWLQAAMDEGRLVGARLFSGLYFLKQRIT